MSEAGDDIKIEEPQEEQPEVETTATDAPKGKLTVEEALQVNPSAPSLYLKLTIFSLRSKS